MKVNWLNGMRRISNLNITFVFLLLLSNLSGCNDSDSIFSFELAPNSSTPLAGVLNIETKEPTRVSIVLTDGTNIQTVDFNEFNTKHKLPVLGFRPARKHILQVMVFNEHGEETLSKEFEVATDPLPEDFPAIEVTSIPDKMEPGVTLFPVGDFLIAVNEVGEVVWYHRLDFDGGLDRDLRRLSNGNLLLLLSKFLIVELDMLGNVVQKWHPSLVTEGDPDSTPVAAVAFHHEVFEMENGNFLVLSLELRFVDNFPTSDTDPLAPKNTATVGGDVVVEYTRDGQVVNEWSLLDMLDPLRIAYGSLADQNRLAEHFPNQVGPIRDWAHANAVIHDTRDDSIIVSARNQDVVFKFSRSTGELIWLLGPHENWDPVEFGDLLLSPTNETVFFWPYHMHAPMLTPDGNILIYDNGNFRASPFDPPVPDEENFSRAVEYAIDEDTKEITLIWEYGQFAQERLFTPFIGDADFLRETGNVLITFGGIVRPRFSAKIIEVTRTTPAEKVFELSIVDNITYRSERLPSLYP